MPTFIDRHPVSAVPSAVRHQMHVEAVNYIVDPGGARPMGHWIEDGTIYCVLDAPNQEAVCAHHAAKNLSCADVHPMATLNGRPFSRREDMLVREAIARLWHAAPLPAV